VYARVHEPRAKTMREAVHVSRIVPRKRQFISTRVTRGVAGCMRAEMTFNSSRCPLAFDRFKRSLRTRLCAKARERHRGKRLLAHVNFAKLQPGELARPRAERSLGVPGVHRSQRSGHDPRSIGDALLIRSRRALIAARPRDIDQYLRQTHKYPDATLKAVPGEGRYSQQCTCSDRVARNVPIWASPKLSTREEKRGGSRRRVREGELTLDNGVEVGWRLL